MGVDRVDMVTGSVVVVGFGLVGLGRHAADDLVGNEPRCRLGGPISGQKYRPEWKIRGSLLRSSANSK